MYTDNGLTSDEESTGPTCKEVRAFLAANHAYAYTVSQILAGIRSNVRMNWQYDDFAAQIGKHARALCGAGLVVVADTEINAYQWRPR
jgi:hypothetical protein